MQDGVCPRSSEEYEISTGLYNPLPNTHLVTACTAGDDLVPLGYGAKKRKTNLLLTNQYTPIALSSCAPCNPNACRCTGGACSCAAGTSYCSKNPSTGDPIWVHQRFCTGLTFKTKHKPLDDDGQVVASGPLVLQVLPPPPRLCLATSAFSLSICRRRYKISPNRLSPSSCRAV